MTRLVALLALVALAAPACGSPASGITDATPQVVWALSAASAQWELTDPAGGCNCSPSMMDLTRYLDTIGSPLAPLGTRGHAFGSASAGQVNGMTLPVLRGSGATLDMILSDRGEITSASVERGVFSPRRDVGGGALGTAVFVSATVESRSSDEMTVRSVWRLSLRFTDLNALGETGVSAGAGGRATLTATVLSRHVLQ